MKNVLVTGSTGFVGRHLVKRLCSIPDLQVVALTREKLASSPTLDVICALEDLTADVWRATGIEKFETVFHLASFTPKSTAQVNNLEGVYRSTIAGTYSLLKGLPSAPGNFVYSSSIDVYGALRGVITEQSPTRPDGLHGASKLFCEAMIGASAASMGFRKVLLRYGHIYGPGENAYQKAIPNFIRAVLSGEQPRLSPGAKNTMRDYLFVDDAVEAMVRAAAYAEDIKDPINIVSGHSVTIGHTLEVICELAGLPLESDDGADPTTADFCQYDNQKMMDRLGVWPLVSLRDGLARELAYMKALRSAP